MIGNWAPSLFGPQCEHCSERTIDLVRGQQQNEDVYGPAGECRRATGYLISGRITIEILITAAIFQSRMMVTCQ